MAKIFDFFKRKPIILTGKTTKEWVKMCKKKFNIDDYKGKYVMHCKTEEEAIDFCNYLHSIGKTWLSGTPYPSSPCWNGFGRATCYEFNAGESSYKDYYKNKGFTILEWEDFMSKKPKESTAWGTYQKFRKENLKNNDIITFQNGKRGIVLIELEAIVIEDLDGYICLSNITSELTSSQREDWDIVKVQRVNYIHQFVKTNWNEAPVIWKRQETVEMTLAEVCEALGKNVKIIKE